MLVSSKQDALDRLNLKTKVEELDRAMEKSEREEASRTLKRFPPGELMIKIHSESGIIPKYETGGSAGMDLKAFLKDGAVTLGPGERAMVPTGLRIELPKGFEAQIRGRSGLAAKFGVGLANGIGTVDSDYRGEIKVILINWGTEPFIIADGDRIAQMVIASYERAEWKPIDSVEELSETARGTGGFGHTGK